MNKLAENKLASDISLLIRANGLGQAMAFLSSRRREDFRVLYQMINQWAEKNLPEIKRIPNNHLEIGLVDLITKCDSARVREIGRDIIDFLKTLPAEIITSS